MIRSLVKQLHEASDRLETWNVDVTGFAAVEPGLIKTYHRGKRAMRAAFADGHAEDFHEWRKRVKYHWYHSRLLRRMGHRMMKPHRQLAAELGTLLGDDHDLAVLSQTIKPGTKFLLGRVLLLC